MGGDPDIGRQGLLHAERAGIILNDLRIILVLYQRHYDGTHVRDLYLVFLAAFNDLHRITDAPFV